MLSTAVSSSSGPGRALALYMPTQLFNLGGGVRKSQFSVQTPLRGKLVRTEQLKVGSLPRHGVTLPPKNGGALPFNRDIWYTLGNGDGQQDWNPDSTESRTAFHWGQLKLLMTEIQFLTLYWNPETIPEPTIVYAGAAPGHHIVVLAKLFPSFSFDLYDPREAEFDSRLRNHPRVRINPQLDPKIKSNGFFTDETALLYRSKSPSAQKHFFICDIRDSNYRAPASEDPDDQKTKEKNESNEKAVEANMKQQANWVRLMDPVRAHLKMRMPYLYDFVKELNPEKKMSYLSGIIYRQPWASSTSSEGRLVPDASLDDQERTYVDSEWDISAYESAFFYHNIIVRKHFRFLNPLNDNEASPLPKLGLTDNWDSSVSIKILADYLEKHSGEIDMQNITALFEFCIVSIGSVLDERSHWGGVARKLRKI